MKYKHITSQVEVITPAIAADYLQYNTKNRTPNRYEVELNVAQMKRGEWMLNGEPIIFANTGVLLDGQHRLLAVIESGVTIETIVTRGIEEEAFKTIDLHRSRTSSDILSIAGIKNAKTISSSITRYWRFHLGLMSGLTNNGGVNIKAELNLTKAGVLSFYGMHAELCQAVFRLIEKMRKLPLLTPAEIGGIALYLILDKQHPQSLVEAFFEELLYKDSTDNQTIARLRAVLIKDRLAYKHMEGSMKQALLAKTWNAFISGRTVKCLKWASQEEGKIDFK